MAEPKPNPSYDADNYSPAVAIAAEGGRIGIVHCLICGAAVMLDMQVGSLAMHDQWHQVIRHAD